MSEDLSEFHDVFFEEAEELVESMEAELLDMLTDPDDPERINTVFRAAHSIKGGSATFGFDAVAEFTHVMETLMDEVRDGSRRADPDLVDLLLKATDCVAGMLNAAKTGEDFDPLAAKELREALEAQLGGGAAEADEGESASDTTAEGSNLAEAKTIEPQEKLTTYKIFLRPARDSFKTANDPMAILAELGSMGDLTVTLDDSQLPILADFDGEDLYLAWNLILVSPADEESVRQTFDWIDANSEIEISIVDGEEISSSKIENKNNTVEVVADVAESDVQEEAESENVRPDATLSENAAPVVPEAIADAPIKKARPKAVASIRVGIDKIDKLINLVGELVITQSMLNEEGGKLPGEMAEKLQEGLSQLQRYTRELQENVMQIRMVPISNAFNRLPRMIHDLSAKLGKKVELVTVGEQTELDKTVLESIGDPLVHLVRNAVDHGIEMPDERVANGKSESGELQLNAFHESGNIIIEIRDDGGGINCERVLEKARSKGIVASDEKLSDAEVFDLLFHPGFSMAERVSDVSGRGVGMDVVRRNIQSLGGSVEVTSALGKGSTFRIRLPLTLAIVDGQLVRVGDQTFVLPLISIVESIQLDQKQISAVVGKGVLYRLRDEYIPLVRLASLFALAHGTNQEPLVVVVESESGKIGLLVDDLLAQQQVVIKSLETNYKKIDGVAGATILGDGTVALILDIDGVNNLSKVIDHNVIRAA